MKKIYIILAIVLFSCGKEEIKPETGLITINLDLTESQAFEALHPVNKKTEVLFRFADSLSLYNRYILASEMVSAQVFEVPASVTEVFIDADLGGLRCNTTEQVRINNSYTFTLTNY
jgi:hypothetical protein